MNPDFKGDRPITCFDRKQSLLVKCHAFNVHKSPGTMSIFKIFQAILIAAILVGNLQIAQSAEQIPDFVYQGKLEQGGVPANGEFDLVFSLWDAASGGSQIGDAFVANAHPVVQGVFSIGLSFPGAFTGTQRYLEVSVDGIVLPRQPVATVPVAQWALGGEGGQGPAGPEGPPGPAGDSGICHGVEKLEITGIEGIPESFAVGGSEVLLSVNVLRGGQSAPDARVHAAGMGPAFLPGPEPHQLSLTSGFNQGGILSYAVIASDGCSLAVETIEIEFRPFQSFIQIVHLSPSLPSTLTLRVAGTSQSFNRTFPGGITSSGSSWVSLASADVVLEVLSGADLIGVIEDFDIEYLGESVIVVHDFGGQWTWLQYQPDQTPPPPDIYQLKLFHAADGVGLINVTSNDAAPVPYFSNALFRQFSAETQTLSPNAALGMNFDLDGNGQVDYRVSLGAGNLSAGSNYVAFAYLRPDGNLGVFILKLDLEVDAWFGYQAAVIDLNVARLSLVHVAANAPSVLRLAADGSAISGGAVGYSENASQPSGVLRASTSHLQVKLPAPGRPDVNYSLLDVNNNPIGIEFTLDINQLTRNTLVVFDDGAGFDWVIWEDDDGPLSSPNGRVGFFNAVNGSGTATVSLASDDSKLFDTVPLGLPAVEWHVVDAAVGSSYPLLFAFGDAEPSYSHTLVRDEIFPTEVSQLFAYRNAGDELRLFIRAYNVNPFSTAIFRYFRTPQAYEP